MQEGSVETTEDEYCVHRVDGLWEDGLLHNFPREVVL